MDATRQGRETEAAARTERAAASLLLRCWVEPSRTGAPVIRGYLRNLKTGEEVAIASVQAVGEHLVRELGLAEASAADRRAKESTA